MAKVKASPKKKVQAKLNTSNQLLAAPADPSVNAPRKFSGFTGEKRPFLGAINCPVRSKVAHRREVEIVRSRVYN